MAERFFEQTRLAARGPLFEREIFDAMRVEHDGLAFGIDLEVAHLRSMAAIEAVGDAQDRGELAHPLAIGSRELLEARVARIRRGAPVVARDQRDQRALFEREADQIGVLDHVGAVFVVLFTTDEVADIVIDTCNIPGDTALDLPGGELRSGAMSTLLGSAIIQAVTTQAAALLAERGIEPPVLISANIPGGDAHNRALVERYWQRLTRHQISSYTP